MRFPQLIYASLSGFGFEGPGAALPGYHVLAQGASGLMHVTGKSPQRMGNEHPSLFPYGPFATADGPIIIASGNNAQFARLCSAVGCSEAAENLRWADMSGRNANRRQLRELLEHHLRHEGPQHWISALREAGVPCAPINDVVESLDYAEELGMQPRITLERDDGTASSSIAHPVQWSRSAVNYHNAPPRVDEHREWVLHWLETER